MGTPRSHRKIQPNFPDCAARLSRYFMLRNRRTERDRAYSDPQISKRSRQLIQADRVKVRSSRSAASQKS